MAIGNVISLERAQAKIEGARGTLEATMTRWLYFVQGTMSWSLEIPVDDTKEAMRTYYNTDNPDGGIPICRLSMELVLSYEEIVWWLNMILEGGNLTGASLGGAPVAYGYTFDPDGTADDLKTFSLVAGDGANIYEFNRCAVSKATIRWNPQSGGESHWRMAVEIWARFSTDAGTFDAVSDITRHKILSRGTKVYSDATGGTLGATQLTGYARSGSIVIDNQLEEKIFSEDTTNVSADFARGEQIITGELLIEFKDNTMFNYYRTHTRRQVRILSEGAVISGANPYTLRLDIARMHIVSFTPGYSGMNRTATVGFVAETDRGSSVVTPLLAYIINASATITA